MKINIAIENLIQANDERKMSYILEIEKLKAKVNSADTAKPKGLSGKAALDVFKKKRP